MDNKEVIEELNKLIQNNPDYSNKNIALTMAIKYIEAWYKVIDEIEKNNPDNYFSDKPIIITKKTVIDIINKHLKEIEE